MVGIYKILCTANQKVYIGKSQQLFHRCKSHMEELQAGLHRNYLLQADFDKYGKDAFEFSLVCEAVPGDLNSLETLFIKEYRSFYKLGGYNLTWGGIYDWCNRKPKVK